LEERDMCYKPILEEFKQYFPSPKDTNGDLITVLIPGAGLGRLLFEFCKAGFKAQGNEFSYFMLLASNFILNCSSHPEEFEIQPLIHTFSNVFWNDAPFKPILIPDELMTTDEPHGEMSMVAGEFVEVYSKQTASWDSVVTCFFIDTANNVIEYIETIYKILKPGGVWINLGPLLYHYTDNESECSIELSWDEVKHIILGIGFEIKNEEIRECYYSSDIDSMLKTVYKCIFFTAVKIN
jgi:carnosine N-methyltransferase